MIMFRNNFMTIAMNCSEKKIGPIFYDFLLICSNKLTFLGPIYYNLLDPFK